MIILFEKEGYPLFIPKQRIHDLKENKKLFLPNKHSLILFLPIDQENNNMVVFKLSTTFLF